MILIVFQKMLRGKVTHLLAVGMVPKDLCIIFKWRKVIRMQTSSLIISARRRQFLKILKTRLLKSDFLCTKSRFFSMEQKSSIKSRVLYIFDNNNSSLISLQSSLFSDRIRNSFNQFFVFFLLAVTPIALTNDINCRLPGRTLVDGSLLSKLE
jgi:hypothetical protein